MRNIYYLIILAVISFSCNENSNSINLSSRDNVSITEIIDSVVIVSLETSEDCLINTIGKVIPYEERYYILDTRGGQQVLCFDINGKFIFKNNNVGRGPEEFAYLADFAIDKYNREMILLVPFGEILHYDLDGRFLSRRRLPEECRAYNHIYPINKDTIVFISASYEDKIIYYSRKENKIVSSCYQNLRGDLYADGRIYYYDNHLYYNPDITNEIVSLSGKEPEFIYSWNFGKMNNKEDKARKLMAEMNDSNMSIPLEDIIGKDKYLNYIFITMAESDRYRIAIIDFENDYLKIFYDKIENKNILFNKTTEGISPFPTSFSDNMMIVIDYGIVPGFNIDVTPLSESILSPEQLSIVKSHNPERENPYLIIYHLKQ